MWAIRCTFWICLAWLLYTYVLYPVCLFAAAGWKQFAADLRQARGAADRRRAFAAEADLPSVSLIMAAHNEAAVLAGKLHNLSALDYPPDRLEFVLVSDGSSDGTARLLSHWGDARARCLVLPERRGKAAALNAGVAAARHSILVFCDAATLLEPGAIRRLVRHFAAPGVGVVCGALHFRQSEESRHTEGLYWRYETLLRAMEARLGATPTPSGALYALRRAAFRPLPAGALLDDLLLLWTARRLGYGVVQDASARGEEIAASSVRAEFDRRVRIALGSFRALPACWGFPMGVAVRWVFLSHKLMRWLVPWFALGLFAASLALARQPGYRVVLALEAAVLIWAGAGALFRRWMMRIPGGLAAYFLLAMNLALAVGLCRCLAAQAGISRAAQVRWENAG